MIRGEAVALDAVGTLISRGAVSALGVASVRDSPRQRADTLVFTPSERRLAVQRPETPGMGRGSVNTRIIAGYGLGTLRHVGSRRGGMEGPG